MCQIGVKKPILAADLCAPIAPRQKWFLYSLFNDASLVYAHLLTPNSSSSYYYPATRELHDGTPSAIANSPRCW